jgi:vitamin B12 transporter
VLVAVFDLRLLSLDNIERIEILKGSQSTLYGSNAVAGVINIISKRPTSGKPQFNGLATYGSFNTFKGNANVSQKTKVLEYDLNYVYYNTDGISEAKDTTGKANFDKDGFYATCSAGNCWRKHNMINSKYLLTIDLHNLKAVMMQMHLLMATIITTHR